MATKKTEGKKQFIVEGFVRISTNTVVGLIQCGVDEFVTILGDHNDSSLEITGVQPAKHPMWP